MTSVYRELLLPARLADGRRSAALCYAVDRRHVQYAGRLDKPDLERFVRQGHGISGANPDYVRNTQAHLAQLGICDAVLKWLAQQFEGGIPGPEQALAARNRKFPALSDG